MWLQRNKSTEEEREEWRRRKQDKIWSETGRIGRMWEKDVHHKDQLNPHNLLPFDWESPTHSLNHPLTLSLLHTQSINQTLTHSDTLLSFLQLTSVQPVQFNQFGLSTHSRALPFELQMIL